MNRLLLILTGLSSACFAGSKVIKINCLSDTICTLNFSSPVTKVLLRDAEKSEVEKLPSPHTGVAITSWKNADNYLVVCTDANVYSLPISFSRHGQPIINIDKQE